MSQNAARMGDAVSTGGAVVTGSGNVFINGSPAATIGCVGTCCLHVGAAVVTGSCSVFINNINAARICDVVGCCAVIASGSGDVFIGG